MEVWKTGPQGSNLDYRCSSECVRAWFFCLWVLVNSPGFSWTWDPPSSASWVAEIKGMCHGTQMTILKDLWYQARMCALSHQHNQHLHKIPAQIPKIVHADRWIQFCTLIYVNIWAPSHYRIFLVILWVIGSLSLLSFNWLIESS